MKLLPNDRGFLESLFSDLCCLFGGHERQYFSEEKCEHQHIMVGMFKPWRCDHRGKQSQIFLIPPAPMKPPYEVLNSQLPKKEMKMNALQRNAKIFDERAKRYAEADDDSKNIKILGGNGKANPDYGENSAIYFAAIESDLIEAGVIPLLCA